MSASSTPQPTLALLIELHERFTYGYSYDNFDVFLNGTNKLDKDSLVAKLDQGGRGGWCYELNQHFQNVLEAHGFKVRGLHARNVFGGINRVRTHQVLLVYVEENKQTYLCDSGYAAQLLRRPMLLKHNHEEVQDGLTWKLEERRDNQLPVSTSTTNQVSKDLDVSKMSPGEQIFNEAPAWILRCILKGEWTDIYRFTLETASPADFLVGNHFHLTYKESFFASVRFCGRSIKNGRKLLADRSFKQYSNDPAYGETIIVDKKIETREEFIQLLKEHFFITLPEEGIDRLWNLEPSVSNGSKSLGLTYELKQ